ncbi:nucleotide pyrophosphohydrolase [Ignicoccus islandicus DSM 13165]|uniref:Nucleotide pyrophosphohydrolase n=1 Tax=Ignicoccus islandicus DSM 13165 TaxID=940295 RepID=A0A0U3FR17_9CREN|nr:MazG nucleotide pyrophosphohydrolase domain-containing protein [Ignicoccus islandicus]ALU11920.1 nucleotide pyrophosphohydrolase [Ignicoccus islandicus DSM 13165]
MCDLRELERVIEERYFEQDWNRGVSWTFLWFIEEIGELSEAILKKKREKIEEEMADVLAWLLSIANVLGIDLCEAFRKKYLKRTNT